KASPPVPAGGAAGKQRGRTEHVVQFSVADHQPGGDVLFQQDRHDGSVLVVHPALERGEVGGEPGVGQAYRLVVHVVGSTSGGRQVDVQGLYRGVPCTARPGGGVKDAEGSAVP